MDVGEENGVTTGRFERLDPAERWMADGLRVSGRADLFVAEEVDMSQAQAAIQQLREAGIKATYTHVFIKAAAVALARNPELHQMVVGSRRFVPDSVDIGLSVAGSGVVAPVLVIKRAHRKTLEEIAEEVLTGAERVRTENEQMLNGLRRRRWLVLTGSLRRLIIHTLMRSIKFRHRGVGTFQVSCLKDVDQFVPMLHASGAILGTGRVRDRVVAIDGKPQVRSTVIITCCADHAVWDGVRATQFVRELKMLLQSDLLSAEAPD